MKNLFHPRIMLLAILSQSAIFAGDVEGFVRDKRGKALGDVIVALTPSRPNVLSNGRRAACLTRTNSNGHFQALGLPGGKYGITATKPGLVGYFIENIEVKDSGKTENINIILEPGGFSIEGKLNTSASSFPRDIHVYFSRSSQSYGDIFYADVKDGRYRITLGDGGYQLRVWAEGWDGFTQSVSVPGPRKIIDLKIFPENGSDLDLHNELMQMAKEDQEIRKIGSNADSGPSIKKKIMDLDSKHEIRLREILKARGWLSPSLVGTSGASAGWILVQHGSPEFQKDCLPFMKDSAKNGELSWEQVALTTDRILVLDGKKQLYGTQFRVTSDGALECAPIEDEAHLDERRKEMGMIPFEEYKARLLRGKRGGEKPGPPAK